ncbi:hypothetical protein J4416_00160 [Candidatus Pacearchaeota archaeon]|nr:hypothetical protein [Candidatus Pacearchaeota archaeon]
MKQGVVEKKHHDNSAGVAGVIFGVMSIVSGVAGILFGFIGFWFALHQFRHSKNKWAVWGMALTIIGFVLGIALTIYLYFFVGNALSTLQGAA